MVIYKVFCVYNKSKLKYARRRSIRVKAVCAKIMDSPKSIKTSNKAV